MDLETKQVKGRAIADGFAEVISDLQSVIFSKWACHT